MEDPVEVVRYPEGGTPGDLVLTSFTKEDLEAKFGGVGDVEIFSSSSSTTSTLRKVEMFSSTVERIETSSTVEEVETSSTVRDGDLSSLIGDIEVASTVGEVEVASTVGDVEVVSTVGEVETASTVGDVEVASTVGDVEVVSTVGEVEVASTVGDVEVASTVGDVEVVSTVGDVEVASTVGEVETASTVGDVEVASTVGDIEVASTVGEVEVASTVGEVEATSTVGDVEVVSTVGDVEAASTVGDLEAASTVGDLEAASTVGDAETSSSPVGAPETSSSPVRDLETSSPGGDPEVISITSAHPEEVVEEEVVEEKKDRNREYLESPFECYLNTLLADLQNTIKPRDAVGVSATPPQQNYYESGGSAPPASPRNYNNHYNGTAPQSPHSVNDQEQVYQQQEVVEVVRSSDQRGQAKLSSVNNNLSELDTLLQDLNNARYTNYSKGGGGSDGAGPTTNGVIRPRPTVDSLLDELNTVGTSEVVEKRTVTYEVHNTTHSLDGGTVVIGEEEGGGGEGEGGGGVVLEGHATPTASSATKELDDLMASLSDFKVKENLGPPAGDLDDAGGSQGVRYNGGATPPEQASPPQPQVAEVQVQVVPVAQQVTVGQPDGDAAEGGSENAPSITFTTTKQEKLRSPALVRKLINASNLQSQVQVNDSAYAKPHKPLKSTPPPQPQPPQPTQPLQPSQPSPLPAQTTPTPPPAKEPTPTPSPTPTPTPPVPKQANQLDSMLGSLATHMTEQGVTTTQKGCCCACDKPIVGQVITALGKTWHPEHFSCAHCNQELGTRNFFEREGRPYCEQDYHNLFSPRCAYCNGPILDKCVTALNTTWHPEHFFCAHCGSTFGEEGFHEKDGKPYCRDDYFNMFAPKCGGCNSPIMDNYISALNAQWHPECFVCRDCRQPFNGGSFFDHEGLPYCETHYHAKRGSLCAGCHKPITGRCITAMFRKFHPEHFVCSFCLKQLNKGTFKEQNDKPYCHVCFDKLFG
ncbi:paxillin isoform X9 [Oratosquilla oratoria]|uniref:paxillin isoform X9 n=1 Tax=Oratosquilla oratoria TaxID=337810 RepID=UPI003F76B171